MKDQPLFMQKSFAAKAQVVPDSKPGRFEALVSVFGNKDSQGDVVEAGAFNRTLAEWVLKERPIPIVWAHQFGNPMAFLGSYDEQEETEKGLRLAGNLEMDWEWAKRTYELMEKGLVVEFSFSGRIRDYAEIDKDDELYDEDAWWQGVRIKDIDLWEAGPCFKGANPDTELMSVKSQLHGVDGKRLVAKEGRVLATKHVDALKSVRDQITEVIDAVDKADDTEDGKNGEGKKSATDTLPLETENPEPEVKTAALTPASRALLALSTVQNPTDKD